MTGSPRPERRHLSPPVKAALIISALITVGWGTQQWLTRTPPRRQPGIAVAGLAADHSYEVPLGTAARAKAGEKFTIMPSVLRAHVGEVIRVVNNDIAVADVGPFSVPPKSTITQKLTRKGTFSGFCVLSPTGRSQLIVE